MAIHKNYPRHTKAGSSIYANPDYREELYEIPPGARRRAGVVRRRDDREAEIWFKEHPDARKQEENKDRKRYNTPYRGGKIAYKFGNSLTEKYLHRKQKTVTCKKKPTTTKRKTIRGKK